MDDTRKAFISCQDCVAKLWSIYAVVKHRRIERTLIRNIPLPEYLPVQHCGAVVIKIDWLDLCDYEPVNYVCDIEPHFMWELNQRPGSFHRGLTQILYEAGSIVNHSTTTVIMNCLLCGDVGIELITSYAHCLVTPRVCAQASHRAFCQDLAGCVPY